MYELFHKFFCAKKPWYPVAESNRPLGNENPWSLPIDEPGLSSFTLQIYKTFINYQSMCGCYIFAKNFLLIKPP